MRVGIFETTHFEAAYPLIKLFDNGVNEITIFCYEESYRQLKYLLKDDLHKFKWIVRKQAETKYRFVYHIYTETRKRKLELLFLNTVTDNFILYAWLIRSLKEVRTIVTLHSINNFFDYRPTLNPRQIIRTFGKKQLVKITEEFNVIALALVDYLRVRLPSFKKIHCIPGAVFEGRVNRSLIAKEKILHLAVTGTVDERRRNYGQVFDLVSKLNQSGLPVSVTLLGGIHPVHGLAVLKKLKNDSFVQRLKYYAVPVVDQREFDEVMNKTDIIFIPSAIHTTILDEIPEIYGQSMSSGNLFDCVKYAKPFIAPVALQVDEYLENSCFRYRAVDEIVGFLKTLITSPDLFELWQRKAAIASSVYTIEAVRKRNQDLFPDNPL